LRGVRSMKGKETINKGSSPWQEGRGVLSICLIPIEKLSTREGKKGRGDHSKGEGISSSSPS